MPAMTTDARALLAQGLARMMEGDAAAVLAPDCVFHVAAPVGELRGIEAIEAGFLRPLRTALRGIRRRGDILIGGRNRRDAGGDWCAEICHLAGTFAAPLWGLVPDNRLVHLRMGAFYRHVDGLIVEARIIPDLIDLMIQTGRGPLPAMLGREMRWPAPATHDGICPTAGDGSASLDLVEAMLGDLTAYDPETFESAGQTGAGGYWADDMYWYGPGGIGSTFTYAGFDRDHRIAFLRAFPDRVGGNHYCRIGDGNYAAVSGWPSMTMTHQGTYLGQPGDGRALTLRVMDFYRCEGGKIAENWVLLDYVNLFAQMGRDLIAESAAL